MEQIVVKTEVQPNGEILLYYVDENAVDSNEDQVFHLEEGTDYEIMEATVPPENPLIEPQHTGGRWTNDEIHKLLVFFLDNKTTFSNALTREEHLWAVACKTMLIGKDVKSCETKLRSLKKKYVQQQLEQQKGYNVTWPLYELSHQAFQDDKYVEKLLKECEQQEPTVTKVLLPQTSTEANGGVIVVKNANTNKAITDDKVEMMLNLYLRYKKNEQINMSSRSLWESIAMELGEESSEYWNKRFLNFKQHYLRLLAKRSVDGPASINWVYMDLFDQIYSDDSVFQNKYADVSLENTAITIEVPSLGDDYWNETELIILVKYYFDCFHEFQDTTIPTNFLWTEVGRLLDKKPEICKEKYEELKEAHYDKYFTGNYTLQGRIALEIVFDNIISKEVEIEMSQYERSNEGKWSNEELDELVKFVHENLEMFKDSVCYFVCWRCIGRSLNRSISDCKTHWENLKTMYKSILNNKMENSDMQIDWPYMDLFDRIFDYGMNTKLLDDFEKSKELQVRNSQKIGVKKVNIKLENNTYENGTDDEEIDDKAFTKRTKRGFGDSKAFKILEYYQKNKEKFATTLKKKQALWDVLAKKLGVTGEQCAHRFRNLKQVYKEYVLREINKPDKPIIWPYYATCKRVFGYRALKSKLKNNKGDFADTEEWSPREIKLLISYFGHHFNELSNNEDLSKWSELAQDLGKTESAIRDRFIELRKSYRRLKTVRENNPAYKVVWKYFNMFNDIYEGSMGRASETMEVDEEHTNYEVLSDERNDDEEDYQCIIVIPEGDEINEAHFIVRDDGDTQVDTETETQFDTEIDTQIGTQIETQINMQSEKLSETIELRPALTKWTKKSKRLLLILYHNYLKARKGQEISPKEMWTEIASKLPSKTPLNCRKMYAKLKINHLKSKDSDVTTQKKTPNYILLEKILNLKPKFPKKTKKKLNEGKPYKDVLLPTNKVELALQYYLQHIDEFASPKFEKKYLWTELANFVSEPVNKLFNKINFLKQNYNVETDEVAGEKTLFSELLREILSKEDVVRAEITKTPTLDDSQEAVWTDDEVEQLLVWYLANLDKFKNPKFVRKYLWLEACSIMEKSPLTCSKKMTEIRTQYKTIIKESPNDLNQWRFYELCQKIYGTGKKNELPTIMQTIDEQAI